LKQNPSHPETLLIAMVGKRKMAPESFGGQTDNSSKCFRVEGSSFKYLFICPWLSLFLPSKVVDDVFSSLNTLLFF